MAGSVKNLTVKGNVAGVDNIGGVAGTMYFATVENCKFEGSVTGTEIVGGIVGANYGSASMLSQNYAIAKADPDVTPPTAKNPTYNGNKQELVTKGSTTSGTMKYSLSKEDDHSETLSVGTEAGTYTVWYKVEGDRNYNDAGPWAVEVTISKQNSNSGNTGGNTGGSTNCPRNETCPIWPFTDASTMAWYHDSVHYCIEKGLMNGYGNHIWGPNNILSRAMLAQILYNLAGRPRVTGSSPFTDVASGAWYADAVIWAAAKGVVEGYGNGKFGPDNPITREQLATMLWRYIGKPAAVVGLSGFKDAGQIGDWAADAMDWAMANGILEGYGDGTLRPTGNATRAEAATMIMRFLKLHK